MLAVVTNAGKAEVQERPDPVPGTGELLVKVRSAGLNAADLLQVAGRYPPPLGVAPDALGLELAGEVLRLGEGASRFSPGNRVMAVVAGAAQAELAVVHERLAMPVPQGATWEEAGGFPEAFTTAHDALFSQGALGMGERLCVHGAAGGVGLAALQLGVRAGARVVASVRNPAHRERVEAFGATALAPESVAEEAPFDVVLELVGAPNFPGNLAMLRTGGRIVVIGVGAGNMIELDLRALMAARARIAGSTLRARSLEAKADAARRVEHHVLPLLDSGAVRVPVHATFALGDAAAAYRRFAEGGKLGKIVLLAG